MKPLELNPQRARLIKQLLVVNQLDAQLTDLVVGILADIVDAEKEDADTTDES